MSHSRWVAAGATLALSVLVLAAAAAPGGRHGLPVAAAAPVNSAWPGLEATPVGRPAASSSASTQPTPTPGALNGASAAPEPYTQGFAQQPGVPRQTPSPSPTAAYRVAPNVDGCDHAYGAITQCVPWTFPAGTTDRCAWLRAHGFGPLKVTGKDRLGLDTNHNGIACDPADV